MARTVADCALGFDVLLGRRAAAGRAGAPRRAAGGRARALVLRGARRRGGARVPRRARRARPRRSGAGARPTPAGRRTRTCCATSTTASRCPATPTASAPTRRRTSRSSVQDLADGEATPIRQYLETLYRLDVARAARERASRATGTCSVCPTVPIPPPPIDGPDLTYSMNRNTKPFNGLGWPALSLPCGADDLGLPGRPAGDRPRRHRRPPAGRRGRDRRSTGMKAAILRAHGEADQIELRRLARSGGRPGRRRDRRPRRVAEPARLVDHAQPRPRRGAVHPRLRRRRRRARGRATASRGARRATRCCSTRRSAGATARTRRPPTSRSSASRARACSPSRPSMPEECVFPKPAHLSFAEAACVGIAGLTTWRGLLTRGGVGEGSTVLVTERRPAPARSRSRSRPPSAPASTSRRRARRSSRAARARRRRRRRLARSRLARDDPRRDRRRRRRGDRLGRRRRVGRHPARHPAGRDAGQLR